MGDEDRWLQESSPSGLWVVWCTIGNRSRLPPQTPHRSSRSPRHCCKLQKSIYKKVSGSILVLLVLCVDDILLVGNDIPIMKVVKSSLRKSFLMKDLGEAVDILGIKIYRDRSKRLIGLNQSAYIDKVLNRYNMQDSKKGFVKVITPGTVGRQLRPKNP
jgi:hypothetical protein